jgi:hypothetical protein
MENNHKCDNCGKGIYVSPYKRTQQKNFYCSRQCRASHMGEVAWGVDKLKYVLENANHMTTKEMAAHFDCGRSKLEHQVSKWRSQGHNIPKFYKKKLETKYKQPVIILPPRIRKPDDPNKRFVRVQGFPCRTWVLR